MFARGITRALAWRTAQRPAEPERRRAAAPALAAAAGALAGSPAGGFGVNAGSARRCGVRARQQARTSALTRWRKRQQANVTVDDVGRRMGVRWGHWESLAGVFASGVSTATTADLLPQVFARSTDRALWQKKRVYRAGSGDPAWTSWESLHGTLTSAPSVIALPELQGEVPLATPPHCSSPRSRRRPPQTAAPPPPASLAPHRRPPPPLVAARPPRPLSSTSSPAGWTARSGTSRSTARPTDRAGGTTGRRSAATRVCTRADARAHVCGNDTFLSPSAAPRPPRASCLARARREPPSQPHGSQGPSLTLR